MAAGPLQSTFDHCYYNKTMFKDGNSTALASQVITTSFSMFFYLGVLVLSTLGVCFKSFVKLFSSPAIFIFFLIGVIMTSANVFNTSGEPSIMLYHRIVSVFLVGVVFVLFGAFLFFKKPNGPSDYPTLGQHQPSMGLLLTIITLPLNATELLILIEAQASRDKTTGNMWLVLVVHQVVFVVQKFIQVAVYVWLRDQTVCSAFRKNAQFYFRVLAFFNFIAWVDSQVNLDRGVYVSRAKQSYGEWFVVLYALYKALLVDYRLVCSLLFLEHSIEVENEAEGAEMVQVGNSESEISIQVGMTSSGRQWRHVGFIVGFSCLLVPFICALFYVRKLHLTVYVRGVATFLGSLIIIASGMVLLLKNNLDFDKRIKESKSVKVMVSD